LVSRPRVSRKNETLIFGFTGGAGATEGSLPRLPDLSATLPAVNH